MAQPQTSSATGSPMRLADAIPQASASAVAAALTNDDTILCRVSIPEQELQKCLVFDKTETVWTAKQLVLNKLAKDIPGNINYGLYLPPANGRAGKYLSEERLLGDYGLAGPVSELQFKLKRRIYLSLPTTSKSLAKLHSRANVRKFFDAVVKHNYERVTNMLVKGIDPNMVDDESGETPLTIAAKGDDVDMLVILYNGGAHLDFRSRDGLTPLHKAATRGMFKFVEKLFGLGGSPDMRDKDGLTALYHCAMTGGGSNQVRAAQLLLKFRCEVGLVDHQGWTELHQAARFGHEAHMELLLMYKADINAINTTGNTPLHVCATWDQGKAAVVLLRRGANPRLKNRAGETPADVAMKAGSANFAKACRSFDANSISRYAAEPVYMVPTVATPRTKRTVDAKRFHASGSVPELDQGDVRARQLREQDKTPQRNGRAPEGKMDLIIMRGDKGFGFRLSGATHSAAEQTAQGQWVRNVDPDGQAARAGLQAGDRLLELNGVDVSFWSHRKVVDEIKRSGDVVAFRIARRLSPGPDGAFSSLNGSPAQTSPRPPMETVKPPASALLQSALEARQRSETAPAQSLGKHRPFQRPAPLDINTPVHTPPAPPAPPSLASILNQAPPPAHPSATTSSGQATVDGEPSSTMKTFPTPPSTPTRNQPPSPPARRSSLSRPGSAADLTPFAPPVAAFTAQTPPRGVQPKVQRPLGAAPPPPPPVPSAQALASAGNARHVPPAPVLQGGRSAGPSPGPGSQPPPMGSILAGLANVKLRSAPSTPRPLVGAAGAREDGALPEFLRGLHDVKLKPTPKRPLDDKEPESEVLSSGTEGGTSLGDSTQTAAERMGISLRKTNSRLSGIRRERSNSIGDAPSRQASIKAATSAAVATSPAATATFRRGDTMDRPEDDSPPPRPRANTLNSMQLAASLRKPPPVAALPHQSNDHLSNSSLDSDMDTTDDEGDDAPPPPPKPANIQDLLQRLKDDSAAPAHITQHRQQQEQLTSPPLNGSPEAPAGSTPGIAEPKSSSPVMMAGVPRRATMPALPGSSTRDSREIVAGPVTVPTPQTTSNAGSNQPSTVAVARPPPVQPKPKAVGPSAGPAGAPPAVPTKPKPALATSDSVVPASAQSDKQEGPSSPVKTGNVSKPSAARREIDFALDFALPPPPLLDDFAGSDDQVDAPDDGDFFIPPPPVLDFEPATPDSGPITMQLPPPPEAFFELQGSDSSSAESPAQAPQPPPATDSPPRAWVHAPPADSTPPTSLPADNVESDDLGPAPPLPTEEAPAATMVMADLAKLLDPRSSRSTVASTSSSEVSDLVPATRPHRSAPPPPKGRSPQVSHVTPECDLVAISARVIYAYEAQFEDELQLEPGSIVTLLETPDGGWWRGKHKGGEGWFPSNYVRPNTMQAEPTSRAQARLSQPLFSPAPLSTGVPAAGPNASQNSTARASAAGSSGTASRTMSPTFRGGGPATSSAVAVSRDSDPHPSGLPLPANTWSAEQVGQFLTWLQLEQYVSSFVENDITGEQLLDLEKDDLKELEVTALGHRKRLIKAVAALQPYSDA